MRTLWTFRELGQTSIDELRGPTLRSTQISMQGKYNHVIVQFLMSVFCLVSHSKIMLRRFNNVDPMHFPTNDGRDPFPKIGLDDKGDRGYIGDRVKRCEDMPDKAWLKKGAKYVFRGSSPNLEFGRMDPTSWDAYPDASRLVLDESSGSGLYSRLCNPEPLTGACQYESTVILSEDVACVGTCTAGDHPDTIPVAGQQPCECSIDEPRTIRVDQPSSTGLPSSWYEYMKEECVNFAFPDAGNVKVASEIGKHWGEYGNEAVCVDQRLAVAGTVCCDNSGSNPKNFCLYRGERTTYATAESRCSELGLATCPWSTVPISDWCGSDISWFDGENEATGMRFSWTSEDCSVKAQVNARGWISVVHDVGNREVKGRVRADVGTYFRVLWTDDSFPTIETCATVPGCEVRESTCLCSTSVSTVATFETSMPSKEELLSKLHIGAADPTSSLEYIKCTSTSCASAPFDVYFSATSQILDASTIFVLPDPVTGDTIHLMNSESTVSIGSYSFRNPPQFNTIIDQTARDAIYETDAVLRHYVSHSNTAPFVAMRLIQHLTTSNPSPRYVGVVSKAFSDGIYEDFGSGEYGCLEAAVAATLLDQEARSTTLEYDATSGKSRSPLLKLMSIFRAMELGTSNGRSREIDLLFMTEKIGQVSI